MTKKQSCCFTGHRPQSLPFRFNENDERCIDLKRRLKDAIIEMITQNGVTHFISGMAIGVDMYAAEIVLELKETYPNEDEEEYEEETVNEDVDEETSDDDEE